MRNIMTLAVLLLFTVKVLEGTYYVSGVEGIKGIQAPGTSNDVLGSNKGSVNEIANRFVDITDKKLGADYGVEIIVGIVK